MSTATDFYSTYIQKHFYHSSNATTFQTDPVLFTFIQNTGSIDTYTNWNYFFSLYVKIPGESTRLGATFYKERVTDVTERYSMLTSDSTEYQELAKTQILNTTSIDNTDRITVDINTGALDNANALSGFLTIDECNSVLTHDYTNTNYTVALYDTYLTNVIEKINKQIFIRYLKTPEYYTGGITESNITNLNLRKVIYLIRDYHILNDRVFDSLSQLLKSVMKKIVLHQRNIFTSILTDLSRDRLNSNFKTPFYYQIREEMITKLPILQNLKDQLSDNSQKIIYSSIIVDLFLKMCYPLVQFLFLSTLSTTYSEKGDFINARLAIYAKSSFVLNFLNMLNTNFVNLLALSDTKTSVETKITTIQTNINRFLDNINVNIDLTSIFNQLKQTSKNVVTKNIDTVSQKEEFSKNQIVLRNLITNYPLFLNKARRQVALFWVLVGLLLLFILVISFFLWMVTKNTPDSPQWKWALRAAFISNLVFITMIFIFKVIFAFRAISK